MTSFTWREDVSGVGREHHHSTSSTLLDWVCPTVCLCLYVSIYTSVTVYHFCLYIICLCVISVYTSSLSNLLQRVNLTWINYNNFTHSRSVISLGVAAFQHQVFFFFETINYDIFDSCASGGADPASGWGRDTSEGSRGATFGKDTPSPWQHCTSCLHHPMPDRNCSSKTQKKEWQNPWDTCEHTGNKHVFHLTLSSLKLF